MFSVWVSHLRYSGLFSRVLEISIIGNEEWRDNHKQTGESTSMQTEFKWNHACYFVQTNKMRKAKHRKHSRLRRAKDSRWSGGRHRNLFIFWAPIFLLRSQSTDWSSAAAAVHRQQLLSMSLLVADDSEAAQGLVQTSVAARYSNPGGSIGDGGAKGGGGGGWGSSKSNISYINPV